MHAVGSWNWWGANATTPSQYQAGWNYTVHYLRHVRGVHNLLSVYAPDKPALYFGEWRGLLERYPGDDLVDVVAFDHYDTGDGNYSSSLADCCAMVAKLAAARSKIPAIAEFGFKKGSEHVNASRSNWFVDSFLRPVVRRMARPPRVAYAMTWTNSERSYWVPSPAQPAHSGFVAFFRSHATLFAADLPPKDIILIGAVRSPRPQAALSPVRTSDDRAAAEK
jgi:mannan endo-1,4-beta-mannosidase